MAEDEPDTQEDTGRRWTLDEDWASVVLGLALLGLILAGVITNGLVP